MNHEESIIQKSIIQDLRHRGILVFSCPNEFVKDARSMGTAISLGLLPGVSDLVMVLPGKVVFLEVKTPTGTQSDKQIKFESKIKELGHSYFIVRSLQDVLNVLGL